ncbi:hypothetical protein Adt_32266 [Abeliophyllum distichum]|uniref:Uncharacterized protein n=1 Tax=Abeliophyllum distichum TaxID=126358 RepID=A0ABD1QSW7_9LAMI
MVRADEAINLLEKAQGDCSIDYLFNYMLHFAKFYSLFLQDASPRDMIIILRFSDILPRKMIIIFRFCDVLLSEMIIVPPFQRCLTLRDIYLSPLRRCLATKDVYLSPLRLDTSLHEKIRIHNQSSSYNGTQLLQQHHS